MIYRFFPIRSQLKRKRFDLSKIIITKYILYSEKVIVFPELAVKKGLQRRATLDWTANIKLYSFVEQKFSLIFL